MFIVLKMVCVCQQDEGESGPVKEISLDFLMEQASQVDSSGTQAPAERWQASGKLVLCCKFSLLLTAVVTVTSVYKTSFLTVLTTFTVTEYTSIQKCVMSRCNLLITRMHACMLISLMYGKR